MKNSQTSKEYETQAIMLENYIKNYQPSCWREPISKVISGIIITPSQAKELIEANNKGKLEEALKTNQDFNKYPAIIEAALSYFKI
ncbi:MAG: hypothetical protein ACP5OG_01345 [Candidatus Nanoarchaeia archaeon]